MPWNFRSCSESSPNAGESSTSSSVIWPRRWLLPAFMDSFFERSSRDTSSERFAKLGTPPLSLLMPKRGRAEATRQRQEERLATEAAGAVGVVDRSTPSKEEGASHRSTHRCGQRYRTKRLGACGNSTKNGGVQLSPDAD